MSSHFTPFTLKDISRPGGGFAMLAVDQREAMRLMFAAAGQPKPIADSVLTDFKVAATRILSPYACNQVNHLIPTRVLVKGGEITCKILK